MLSHTSGLSTLQGNDIHRWLSFWRRYGDSWPTATDAEI